MAFVVMATPYVTLATSRGTVISNHRIPVIIAMLTNGLESKIALISMPSIAPVCCSIQTDNAGTRRTRVGACLLPGPLMLSVACARLDSSRHGATRCKAPLSTCRPREGAQDTAHASSAEITPMDLKHRSVAGNLV